MSLITVYIFGCFIHVNVVHLSLCHVCKFHLTLGMDHERFGMCKGKHPLKA